MLQHIENDRALSGKSHPVTIDLTSQSNQLVLTPEVAGMQCVPPTSVAEAYFGLAGGKAAEVRQSADYVRSRIRKIGVAILEIGAALLQVRERLPHGQFAPWLEAEFAWTDRTAQRYMSAAEAFPAKSDTVSDLMPTTIYALASPSTPAEVREDVIKRREAGEHLPDAAIQCLVREARHTAKLKREELRKSPEARKREKARKARQQREQERAQQEWAERQARRDASLSRLVTRIVEKFGAEVPAILQLLDEAELSFLARAVAREAGLGDSPPTSVRQDLGSRSDGRT